MTALLTVAVVVLLAAVACLAGRWGADSRPTDPQRYDPQWPFARHDG